MKLPLNGIPWGKLETMRMKLSALSEVKEEINIEIEVFKATFK
jgi:hypothetical protein